MKIVFATGNRNKLREAQGILGPDYELSTPADMGITEEIPETGETLDENSLQKARYVYDHADRADCFADDTGLEVEALGGAPGVYSARYAGEGHDNEANMAKLLGELSKLGEGVPRKARFRCVVTLILDGTLHQFEGVLNGRIALERSGKGGFGYDPIFIPDIYPDRTLADLSAEEKNAISHRGRAMRQMAAWLAENNR